MNRMIRRLFILTIFFVGSTAYAQDPEAAQREAERLAREEATRQQQERYAIEMARSERERVDRSMADFLKDSRENIAAANNETDRRREMEHRVEYDRLRTALRAFQIATEQLAMAIPLKAKLKDPAGKIRQNSDAFLDFIRKRTKVRPRFEPGELKEFTASQLAWEALTSAERTIPNLAAVVQSQDAVTVDVGFLLSLSKLELELLRLKWMFGKVK